MQALMGYYVLVLFLLSSFVPALVAFFVFYPFIFIIKYNNYEWDKIESTHSLRCNLSCCFCIFASIFLLILSNLSWSFSCCLSPMKQKYNIMRGVLTKCK
jgi:hypothetical protein